jgi:hypothetical protein
MTLEDRVDALERHVSRYRGAMMVMALVLVAGVVMGQAPRDVEFREITCRKLTFGAQGEGIGELSADAMIFRGKDGGIIISHSMVNFVTKDSTGPSVSVGLFQGVGVIAVHQEDGNIGVGLASDSRGGEITVYNNTRDKVITMKTDEYGNGVVGAYNRKGLGRTLTPR